MKTIIELISNEVMTAFKEAGYDENMGKVTLSNRPDLCEYQCNGAMAGAKVYHKAPIMIANDVVAKLADSKVLEMAEAVNPGFINLKVSGAYMAQYLEEMRNSEKMGVEEAKDPQTMILDYGGPNVAKPLHVGHLRSAIIGESIKRMGRYLGHKVIGDVHLGDWGLQMGLIITELHISRKITKENIRQKLHLPSVSWKKFIRQPVENQKKTNRIKQKLWKQPISCRWVTEDIVHYGNIFCRYRLLT